MSPQSDKEMDTPPSIPKKETSSRRKGEGEQPEEEEEEELSDEDKELKENLELCVGRLAQPSSEESSANYGGALEMLRNLIRASTTSMTSVPKPLKFLKPHYGSLVRSHRTNVVDPELRKDFADILSVLSMTEERNEAREAKETKEAEYSTLHYKLQGHPQDLVLWGHEYVRHLSAEIVGSELRTPEILALVREIVPYHMKHHAEAEAVDLLMEVEQLDLLINFIDESVYGRVCLYLTSCVPYVPNPENVKLLETALDIFKKYKQYPQALRVAMQLNDDALIQSVFNSVEDINMLKQLSFMLGRQQHTVPLDDKEDSDDIADIMNNTHLNNNFLNLARELDIMEPKTPEDVYKSHLDYVRPSSFGSSSVDSARQNLASSFVNGFVNAAFGQDKLLMDDGSKWLYKNKEHGMMSATASIGMILLWDVDGGLTQIDKYLYSPEDYIKSGALLACGIVNTGIRNECDPALALLSDYVLHSSNVMRVGSIFGLGLAYAGSNRSDVINLLLPIFADSKSTMEVIGITALACGLISVGSCNGDVTSTILQTLMERKDAEFKDPFAKYLPLGIGLCYLGKQDKAEATFAALEVLSDPFVSMAMTLVEICAYAGTGNVLRIQNLLYICSYHYEAMSEKEDKKDKKKKDDKKDEKAEDDWKVDKSMQQAVAVIGLALIAMGEEIGSEMLYRTFGHLLRYCEPVVRRTVPLALGLISISNPQLNILDTLSKFSHDHDPEVAHNSIFALGLIGAGTNNARLAAMLRQLAQYHSKDQNNLFMVRIAQGLVHMGKGTLTLNPYHSDSQLMSPVAVAGLLGCLIAFLDVKQTILSKSHYLLYSLSTAISPRMLITFDEDLSPLPVSVRVGRAVDVVGQAGKPKTITGFQTHTTPVLLSHGERAELATEEYLPVTPIMEGFVILKKNPDY